MRTDSIRRKVAVAATCALSLICVGSAHATVGPAPGGEPPTTKGTTNTWHFAYTTVSTGYQMCFTIYKDGQVLKSYGNFTSGWHPPAGANGGMCTGIYTGNQTSTIPFTWSGLQHGSTYEVCAVSFENYNPPGSDQLWFMRVKTLDSCSRTTIDNGKPALTTWVGGEAQYTNNPIIPIDMQYQDSLSHPWSQDRSNGLAKAATIGCLTREASCTPNAYVEGCSTPMYSRGSWTPGTKTNHFRCGYDFTTYADGRVTFCAYQADSALVDRPSDTNQYAGQGSANANHSDVSCGNVILDRAGPTLNAGADRTVKVGDLVTLNATASDAHSGVGQISWTFGDNTAGSTGASATHTYTQPGTYVAKATAKDGTGNTGEDAVTITVQPRTTTPPPTNGGGGTTNPGTGTGGGGTTNPGTGTGGGGTTNPGTGTGGGTGGGTTDPGTGGGTTNPGTGGGTTNPTTGGGTTLPSNGGTTIPNNGGTTPPNNGGTQQPVAPAEVKTIIVREGGANPTTFAIAGLDVSAPRSFKLKRGAQLPVVLDAEGPGVVALALVKGAKVVARGGTTLTAAGVSVAKLKLPKGLKAGSYSLRVSFTPNGAPKATTKKLAVKISASKAKARAAAVPEVGPRADDVPTKR